MVHDAHDRIPESHRDLLDARFATLATIGEDGYPQVSEVWFLAEDDHVCISLNRVRQKTKNLLAEPNCTVFILDLANPFRYLEIRGTADVTPDDDRVFADRVGAKYGADLREHDLPGDTRVVVRVQPVRVNAVDMSR
jgi:PPOX class probable F420-dependent enzyme